MILGLQKKELHQKTQMEYKAIVLNVELEKHNNDLKQANSVLNLNSKKYGKKVRNHQNKELSLKTELKNPSILLEKLKCMQHIQ